MTSPYRIPAPPPPPPTWWERHGAVVTQIIAWVTCAIVVGLGFTCIVAIGRCNDEQKAEDLRQFEERVRACPIIELDRGRQADPIMVVLDCHTFRERRQVPAGFRLPQPEVPTARTP